MSVYGIYNFDFVAGKFQLFNFFLKMDQSRPLFIYCCSFLITISTIQIENSVDGVLGI